VSTAVGGSASAGKGKGAGVISRGSLNKANREEKIRALAGGERERAAPAEQRKLDCPCA
jgi:methyl coenzyme M reductase subunit C